MTVSPGRSFPLGTVVEGGVNFCVFSRQASAVDVLLFDGACDAEAARAGPPGTLSDARAECEERQWTTRRAQS